MKSLTLPIFFLLCINTISAQTDGTGTPTASRLGFFQRHAMYASWGYNRETYSKSDLHFSDGSNYDFTVHQATASDRPTFNAILEVPWEITIPQYNVRFGVFLDEARTAAVEINFDHTKYVVDDWQQARVSGQIGGKAIDEIRTLDPDKFLHFEHTNGANFLQINYVRQLALLKNKTKSRSLLTGVAKIGAGIVIPKTDVTLFGTRLDNEFHIAGYTAGLEAGVRYYPIKRLFIEPTLKGGFADYTDVLTIGTGRANHSFWYAQAIVSVGYEWCF